MGRPKAAASGPGPHSFLPPLPCPLLCRCTAGEVHQLHGEVVRKMDALAAEVRRALAAVSLAQSVALGARPLGGRGATGRGQRVSPQQGATSIRHRQWSYGQLSAD